MILMGKQEQSLEERTKVAVRILSHISDNPYLALYVLEASPITPKEPLYAALAEGFSKCLDEERKDKNVMTNGSAVSELLKGMIEYCKEKSGYFGRSLSL